MNKFLRETEKYDKNAENMMKRDERQSLIMINMPIWTGTNMLILD